MKESLMNMKDEPLSQTLLGRSGDSWQVGRPPLFSISYLGRTTFVLSCPDREDEKVILEHVGCCHTYKLPNGQSWEIRLSELAPTRIRLDATPLQ
jgi:hypothetical protein